MNNLDELFAYSDWAGDTHALDWKPKDPVEYDEVELKKNACSHLEQDKFIDRQGNEQIRCKACQKWDSE